MAKKKTTKKKPKKETKTVPIDPLTDKPMDTDFKKLEPMNPLSGKEIFEAGLSYASKFHENMWVVNCGKCEKRYSHRTDQEKKYGDGKHYSNCPHCQTMNRVAEPTEVWKSQ